MLKYKKVKVVSFELVKVTCNKCKRDISVQSFDMGSGTNITLYGGFASEIVDPLSEEGRINFTICDPCMIEFIKTFKIKVGI